MFLSLVSLSAEEDFSFSRIGLDEGLSHSRIYALLQDDRGFMWIGTSNGLNRYDGRSFRYYKNDPDDKGSLPHNYVTSLIQDSSGYIWIGTDGGGAARLDPRSGQFLRYAKDERDESRRISDNYVWGLLEDSKGRIWMGTTYGGVSLVDPRSNSIRYFEAGSGGTGLSHNNVWPIVEDGNGDVWIGTDGGGINRYIESTGRFIQYRHNDEEPDSLSSDYIFSLYIDSGNTLWVGTSGGGLNRFDRKSESFVSYRHEENDPESISNNSIRAIKEDSRGRFWVGTTDGLNLMNRETGAFRQIFHKSGDMRSLAHSRIHTIMEDRGGVLWFGTRDGISLYTNPLFNRIAISGEGADIPRRNDIRAILSNGRGGLYAGTYQGLFEISGAVQKEIFSGEIVYALHRGSDGSLFCGTDRGFYLLEEEGDGISGRRRLADGVVNQIKEDLYGAIWIATAYDGLFRYDMAGGSLQQFSPEDPTAVRLSSFDVSSLMLLDDGNLLIGSRDNPLLLMDTQTLALSEPSDPLFSGISSYYMTRSDRDYFFALDQRGLLIVDRLSGERKILREKSGLPSDIIRSVLIGEEGDIWISTLKGIARYDKARDLIFSYGIEDGLPGLIYNPAAAFRDRSGNLYFGSTGGLAFLERGKGLDSSAREEPRMAVEVFRSLSMEENIYREGENLELDADNRMLIVKLTAFDYSRPGDLRYAYRFGEKDDWIEIGVHGEIIFSHLAPGRYSLHLRSGSSGGLWFGNELNVPLIVKPSLLLRWYMLVFYGLILLGVLIAVIRLRSRMHLGTIRRQEALVRERTAELEEAKRELEREMRLKSTYFINLAHETKTPLTFIQNYIQRYMEKKGADSDLRIVRDNVDKLVRDMVNYLDSEKMNQNRTIYNHDQICSVSELVLSGVEMVRSAAEVRGLDFNSEIEPGLFINGDPLAVDRIFNNLVDNALKYNREKGSVRISLRSGSDGVILEVRDSGKGISESRLEKIFDPFYQSSHRKEHIQGIGMGLSIVRRILENMGARILVESEKDRGSVFRIIFKASVPPGSGQASGLPSGHLSFRSPLPQLPQDVFHSEQNKTIVLIDDDRDMLRLLAETLSDRYNLVFSESAEDILERIPFLKSPDLIISDVMLGGMDGHELLLRIQEGPWKSAPFIFLSARGGRQEELQGIDEGAVDYIAKPFRADELTARIEARLKGQRRREEIYLSNIREALSSRFNPGREGLEDRIKRLAAEKDLSPREEEILGLLARGQYNKEIASDLGISVRTVEKHLYNLFRKTGVQSRLELINLLH
nr:two-component regulator propeller domain-containing protein [Spirochaeta isovalerica]